MSKYYKAEDVDKAIERIKAEVSDDNKPQPMPITICNWLFGDIKNIPTIEASEDCISREYVLGEAFASDEYNRETKSFDLPVVSVRDIEDAPSVVPTTERAIESELMGETQTQVIEFPDTHQKFVFTRKIKMDGDCVTICGWEYKGVKDGEMI